MSKVNFLDNVKVLGIKFPGLEKGQSERLDGLLLKPFKLPLMTRSLIETGLNNLNENLGRQFGEDIINRYGGLVINLELRVISMSGEELVKFLRIRLNDIKDASSVLNLNELAHLFSELDVDLRKIASDSVKKDLKDLIDSYDKGNLGKAKKKYLNHLLKVSMFDSVLENEGDLPVDNEKTKEVA